MADDIKTLDDLKSAVSGTPAAAVDAGVTRSLEAQAEAKPQLASALSGLASALNGAGGTVRHVRGGRAALGGVGAQGGPAGQRHDGGERPAGRHRCERLVRDLHGHTSPAGISCHPL